MRRWWSLGPILGIAALLVGGATAPAGEKDFLHCFYFTPLQGATPTDWTAFFAATDGLQGKAHGMKHVWYGKLNRPMESDPPRVWGVCMEFGSAADFRSYAASPIHANWEKAYFKVRDPGTTTTDLTGQ